MIPKLTKVAEALAPGAAGALIGVAGWGQHVGTLTLTLLLPLVWAASRSRVQASLAVLAYYLGAARGLPPGAQVFFGRDAPVYLGVALWLASSAALALPWMLLWPRHRQGYGWRLPVIFVLLVVPPLGIIGWTHPLTAAGVLFPGWGWIGLAACGVLMRILIQRPLYASALVLVLASLAGAHPLSCAPVNWFGRDTHYGPAASGSAEALTRFFVLQELIDQARYVPVGSITLYPELLVGDWRQATDQLWRQRAEELAARNATLVIGAQVPLADGRYDNALVTVGAQGGQQLIQRLPVPISMWRPFLNSGARAHLTMTGVYALRGKRVAVLICYEQLLVWPVLVSMAFSPDLILAASNAWWARETSIPGIQKTALRAWSRLFNIPVVSAFNR